jgi:hypothetical protein
MTVMEQKKFIPDQHVKTRSFFRLLGPVLLLIGAACMIIAFIDFFTLQGFEEPKYFWLFFVALPVIFVGFVLSGLGFGGSVAKYQSREYAPVVKDTFNYLAKETNSGVSEVSRAIKQESVLTCRRCQKQNASNAKFCNGCGENLVKVCGSCQQENTEEARFCNHCGTTLL